MLKGGGLGGHYKITQVRVEIICPFTCLAYTVKLEIYVVYSCVGPQGIMSSTHVS
jgi:hypothetical protein